MRENLTLLHVNNKGTDQLAHPCSLFSLLSEFVIRYLEIIAFKLVPYINSIFLLPVVAEVAGLSLAGSQTSTETAFLASRLTLNTIYLPLQ